MKKIRTSKKGFTLAELLIVVAIIGVLVGISIPIFTSQLEKSREATDVANLRAAKAAITAAYLDDSSIAGKDFVYDAQEGKLLDPSADGYTAPAAYGVGTVTKGNTADGWKYLTYEANTVATGKIIHCSVAADGTVSVAFQ